MRILAYIQCHIPELWGSQSVGSHPAFASVFPSFALFLSTNTEMMAPCYYLQLQRKCLWKWPVWSRPSVFHQQLFAVIILQCWCQTRPDWRGEANGPFPPTSPLCLNHRHEEGGGGLIHLKCDAAVFGSKMFRESPLKEHYVTSDWMMAFQLQGGGTAVWQAHV